MCSDCKTWPKAISRTKLLTPDSKVTSDLEGGDVEILPEGQPQHIQVLTAISKCTGECDEDYQERKSSDR